MDLSRSYTELSRLLTFDERFDYLMLSGVAGAETFGFDRFLNQHFYTSKAWKAARDHAIVRDNGCDLGIPGHDINVEILVHHMNPISAADIENGEPCILDPEFLITTTRRTHNAIHFGDKSSLPEVLVDRRPNDTKLW